MKKFQLNRIGVLIGLTVALMLFAGCGTVFAPKDSSSSGSERNTIFSSSSSSTSSRTMSTEEEKALSDYERIQKAEAHHNLGTAYLRSGRHNMALAEYKAALKLMPKDYNIMYDIGLVYLLWNNPEEAIPYFENVLELKPDYAAAINSLGNAYLSMQDYDSAIAYYDQISDEIIYATPYMPMANKGLAYFNKGDYAKAEECYKAALKMEPEYINALVLLGQLQTETGNTKEALKNLQKAMRIESAPVVQYYLAMAYVQDGDKNNAIKNLESILRVAATDSEIYEKSANELRKLRAPVEAME